jgi:hypothetical protein
MASEAAVLLNRSPRWVREQCRDGHLEATFYGGAYDITPDAIERYKAKHAVRPAPPKGRRRPRRAA